MGRKVRAALLIVAMAFMLIIVAFQVSSALYASELEDAAQGTFASEQERQPIDVRDDQIWIQELEETE